MKKIKTAEHIWSVMCSSSAIDNETNNVTLFNLIESITVTVPASELAKLDPKKTKGFLFAFPFEIISRFKKTSQSKVAAFDYRLKIIDQNGLMLPTTAERKIAFTEGIKNMRVRSRFNVLPVNESGEYSIVIEAKDIEDGDFIEVGRVPLEVTVIKEQQAKK